AVIWDEAQKDYAFIINRFDVGEHGKKLPQITLNALMKSPEKYAGSMKQIAEFLSLRLEASQKTAFVRYIFVNALLYNADLHKKNISFIEREVGGKKTLLLSPAYDIINVASLKGLKPFACAFAINGRQRKIRIKDFKGVFESLGLAWDESVLADIADIYKEKYPLYLESLKSFERFSGCEKYKRKCELLYKENLCYLGWN
ncbi:HipA domain-containing protein, partial [Campylobacter sp.]